MDGFVKLIPNFSLFRIVILLIVASPFEKSTIAFDTFFLVRFQLFEFACRAPEVIKKVHCVGQVNSCIEECENFLLINIIAWVIELNIINVLVIVFLSN